MISEYGEIHYTIQFGFEYKHKKFDLGCSLTVSAMRKIMLTGIHPFGESDYNIFRNL